MGKISILYWKDKQNGKNKYFILEGQTKWEKISILYWKDKQNGKNKYFILEGQTKWEKLSHS